MTEFYGQTSQWACDSSMNSRHRVPVTEFYGQTSQGACDRVLWMDVTGSFNITVGL